MANVAALQSQAELEQLKAQMAAMQAQAIVDPGPVSTPIASGNADLLAHIQQLAQLKDSGVLSEEEFQAAKAKLLG